MVSEQSCENHNSFKFSIAIIYVVFVFVICDMILDVIVKDNSMMRSWLTQILHLGSLQLRIVDPRISIVDMPQ